VREKNVGLRVNVDYRGVNKNIVPDQSNWLINMIGREKPKAFTSLDLMKGYHQVKISEDSKLKAFTCHMGFYQYCRMPFGLTNAPTTFQR